VPAIQHRAGGAIHELHGPAGIEQQHAPAQFLERRERGTL